ncbi:sensor domain-containing diguanylate cyclase [Sporosarcina ureilytica]|uniref:Sensor domain-containing diguanylate cyclase n=1 Tax=Sporosarcina ureilytica TaxID=298596 RepID=A0A1D8JDC2_9BACL|nr:diguanylate cyclase [Sporosarcina ureilytica]AOV06715.1 hypothetical protein BI350_03295 [Sporosarcina ureilytica]
MQPFNLAVLDSLVDQIAVLDHEGVIIAHNQSWINFSNENGGNLRKNGVGANYVAVCPEDIKNGIMQVLAGKSDHFTYEYPCHSTHEYRWFLLRVTPIKINERSGAVVSHVNITDRKLLEIGVERKERLYRHIAENSTDFISLHTRDGAYTYVSPNYSLLGYSSSELVGKSPHDFIHEDDIQKINDLNDDPYTIGETKTSTYRFRCKNGRYIWMESKYKFVLSNDDVAGEMICVSRDVTKNKQKLIALEEEKQSLRKTVYTDSLTGVSNRRYFKRQFKKMYQQSLQDCTPFSLVIIDIDYFKQYNDTYGHQKGDECLSKVANALARGVRENDTVCRIGGEEFCMIFPHTNKEKAISLAERICRKVEGLQIPHHNSAVSKFVTVSAGVSSTSGSFEYANEKELFRLADQALYSAKKDGRNCVRF